MNRSDLAMMLGQAENLGDTLMRNRVLKQQETERNDLMGQRERFQQQDVNLRRDELKARADDRTAYRQDQQDWRAEQADDKRIALAIQNNAHGTMDDASRKEFNAWIASHPKLRGTGLSLIPPPTKEPGTMETADTRNFKQLQELQAQIAKATTPQEKQQAEAQLATFESMIGRRGNENADPYDPAQKAALSAGGAEWAKANAAGDRETADRVLTGINATRANAGQGKGKPPAATSVQPQEVGAPSAGRVKESLNKRATEIHQQHPDWTVEQVKSAVKSETKGATNAPPQAAISPIFPPTAKVVTLEDVQAAKSELDSIRTQNPTQQFVTGGDVPLSDYFGGANAREAKVAQALAKFEAVLDAYKKANRGSLAQQ